MGMKAWGCSRDTIAGPSTTTRKKGPKDPAEPPRSRRKTALFPGAGAITIVANPPSHPERRTAPHNLEEIPGILNPRLDPSWVENSGHFSGGALVILQT
jgi:hypothetical protein